MASYSLNFFSVNFSSYCLSYVAYVIDSSIIAHVCLIHQNLPRQSFVLYGMYYFFKGNKMPNEPI